MALYKCCIIIIIIICQKWLILTTPAKKHMRWDLHLNLVIDTTHVFCDYNSAIILIFNVLEL